MFNFTYQRNTKLIFGNDNFDLLASEIKNFTNKKILLTYGGGSIKKSGLYDIVKNQLNENGIEFIELSGIKPNPEVSTAREGAKIIKDNNIEFILAVGGGSVLDNSKHMAMASVTDHDVWDLIENQSLISELSNLPKIGAIITLAATGSEMNQGGVLSNPDKKLKLAMGHPECVPVFTFEDPTQLFTLPKVQRQAGVCDTLSHLLEMYFNDHKDVGFADRMVEALMINLIENYKSYLEDNIYDVHANIFITATYALNGLTSLGRNGGDWLSHAIEHEFSAYTDMTHGIGLSIIHPKIIRKYVDIDIENGDNLIKYINLGKNVFNLSGDEVMIAKAVVNEVENLFYSMSGVRTLADTNINSNLINVDESISKLGAFNIEGNYVKLSNDDFKQIYLNSIGEEK